MKIDVSFLLVFLQNQTLKFWCPISQYFSLIASAFVLCLRNLCLSQEDEVFFYVSSRYFIVSTFAFRLMIHFKLLWYR